MEPWRPVDAGNGGMEDQNGVSRPVVADSHHIDEKHNPDPDQSERSDSDPHQGDADPQHRLDYVTKYVFFAVLRIRIRDPVPF